MRTVNDGWWHSRHGVGYIPAILGCPSRRLQFGLAWDARHRLI